MADEFIKSQLKMNTQDIDEGSDFDAESEKSIKGTNVKDFITDELSIVGIFKIGEESDGLNNLMKHLRS
jgi:hypothetical protein